MGCNHISRLNAHSRSALEKIADHVSDGKVAQLGPLTAVSVGLPTSVYNQIFAFEPPVDENLEEAISWMADRELPYWVTVPKPVLDDISEQFAELGLTKSEKVYPGMMMPSLAEVPSTETSVDISAVTDSAQHGEFVKAFSTVFETTPEYARRANPLSMLDDDDMELFIGYSDGNPVACAHLIQTGDVAGVYSVGVQPDARRQGIGEAMTWAVLRSGRAAGCEVGVLQSTEMAYSLYQRMGFETIVNYHYFEPAT